MVNPFRYVVQASLLLALCREAACAPVALSTVWEVVTVTACEPACGPPVTTSADTSVPTGCDDSTSIETTTTSSSSTSPSAEPTQPSNAFRDRNFKTIHHIYNLTIFPNQVPIITYGGSAVPDGLFADHATGRISPVGNFTDFEDSIEYFFALPPLPISNKNSAAFTRFELVQFSSECPEVAATTVYLYASVVDATSPDNGKLISILKQTGFWRFNKKGEVINYDLDLVEVDHFIEELTSTDYSDPASQAEQIQTVCFAQSLRCTGANREYDSIEHCVEVLSQKPFGSYTDIWSDSVVCRSIHLVLTLTRPDAHCPHVGPTGGMKCVDFPYQTRQFDDQRLFGRTDLFRCPGATYY